MPEPPSRLTFFHDSRHPLIYMYEPPMAVEEYEAAVDELAGTPVDTLAFCLGDGRTVLHDSQVGELWGHHVERWPHLVFRRAHHNARRLIEAGCDPLRIVCDRAHAVGLKLVPVLLVQQGRGPREQDVRCSEFRFQNAHLEIGAAGDLDAASPACTCLDFAHDEVREERFALVEETLQRYPVDGFELQLNYVPHYFHPARVDAGRPLMSAWIGRVSEAVQSSGLGRHLAVRVPCDLEACYDLGMDVIAWMREGLVQSVIGQTYSGPELVDCTADFRGLVAAGREMGVHVMAAQQSLVDSDRLGQATIEVSRACASNYWAQGVDGLYLAHWFGHWPYGAAFYEQLRELPHPQVMAPRDKHYYVPTATGRYPEPQAEPGTTRQLPAPLLPGKPVDVELPVADDLPHWHQRGRVHEVILRVRLTNITEMDQVRFELNGQDLPAECLRRIDETYRMQAPRYRAGSAYWFVFRPPESLWPRLGDNRVTVRLLERTADTAPDIAVRDVELEVRYLMGRAFHRGYVDGDLGQWSCDNT